MNAEERFDYYVKELESKEEEGIGRFLMIMAEEPSGDKRMLAYLAVYLGDRRPTMVRIKPEYFAEVRYAAGAALASERARQGMEEPVVIPDTVIPITWDKMAELARKARLDFVPDPLKLLNVLLEKNLVPKRHEFWRPRLPFRG